MKNKILSIIQKLSTTYFLKYSVLSYIIVVPLIIIAGLNKDNNLLTLIIGMLIGLISAVDTVIKNDKDYIIIRVKKSELKDMIKEELGEDYDLDKVSVSKIKFRCNE